MKRRDFLVGSASIAAAAALPIPAIATSEVVYDVFEIHNKLPAFPYSISYRVLKDGIWSEWVDRKDGGIEIPTFSEFESEITQYEYRFKRNDDFSGEWSGGGAGARINSVALAA